MTFEIHLRQLFLSLFLTCLKLSSTILISRSVIERICARITGLTTKWSRQCAFSTGSTCCFQTRKFLSVGEFFRYQMVVKGCQRSIYRWRSRNQRRSRKRRKKALHEHVLPCSAASKHNFQDHKPLTRLWSSDYHITNWYLKRTNEKCVMVLLVAANSMLLCWII